MKKIYVVMALSVLAACGQKIDVDYSNTLNGCEYSEYFQARQYFPTDWFGTRDKELHVAYEGVKCENIINTELKKGMHKTPYGVAPVVMQKFEETTTK